MKDYKKEILDQLLDKYEASKSFIGTNTVKQSFVVEIRKVFPEYADDSKVKEIQQINNDVLDLSEQSLIVVTRSKNGILKSVKLNTDKIDDCYKILKRTPKRVTNEELLKLLKYYENGEDVVNQFCQKQIERINSNKKVEHFKGNIQEYVQLLKVLDAVTKVYQETYIRDFSIRVLGDSKAFEKYRNTIISILDEYGDYPERDSILEDLNIIRNPGHVYVKGNAVVSIKGQCIDLNLLDGDIAFSSSLLQIIEKLNVRGKRVISIENLTTFNAYEPNGDFVIYLGGYHNSLRRKFIKHLYEQNPDKEFYHYGDIDAGGFYILLHLRRKTGVMFQPLNMDVKTLENNRKNTKKLSDHDVKRLKDLMGNGFDEVIEYMLKNNCKLEQEALD